ncbi:MAG: hypothetical protein ACOYZ7_11105 [Chloroflexota bacterium]
MELVRPKMQREWGSAGVVNFVLGGMGAGYYLQSSLVIILQTQGQIEPRSAAFKLLAPALVGLGFLALAMESSHIKSYLLDARRILRSRHMLRYLRHSWMSRETLAAAIFCLAALLDWLLPHPVLWGLASVAAIGLILSHGFIIYRSVAVIAWHRPLIPLFFLTSAWVTGSGLALLVSSEMEGELAAAGLLCAALNVGVWLFYLYGSQDTAFCAATRTLRRPQSLWMALGIGHLLPMLLLLTLLLAGSYSQTVLWRAIAAWAGLALMAGGAVQKSDLVRRAGYLRGIVMAKPERRAPEKQHPSIQRMAEKS